MVRKFGMERKREEGFVWGGRGRKDDMVRKIDMVRKVDVVKKVNMVRKGQEGC